MPPFLFNMGMAGLSGVMDSYGWKLGEALGLTPDTGGSAGARQTYQQGISDAMGASPGLMTAGLYSAAGQTGANTRRTFERQLDQLAPSVRAQESASYQRRLGSQALSGAQSQARTQQEMAQRSQGNVTRNMMSQGTRAGLPASALSAASRATTAQSGQNQLALASQLSSLLSQARQQAAQSGMAAENILSQDRAQMFETNVKPYMAQFSSAPFGLAGQLGQDVTSAGQAAATQARTNPLAGLTNALGMYAGGGMTNAMGQQASASRINNGAGGGSDLWKMGGYTPNDFGLNYQPGTFANWNTGG